MLHIMFLLFENIIDDGILEGCALLQSGACLFLALNPGQYGIFAS